MTRVSFNEVKPETRELKLLSFSLNHPSEMVEIDSKYLRNDIREVLSRANAVRVYPDLESHKSAFGLFAFCFETFFLLIFRASILVDDKK